MPVGSELKKRIAEALDFPPNPIALSGDDALFQALVYANTHDPKYRDKFGELRHAARHIRDAMPLALSIDNFVDHQDNDFVELCAKLAIVSEILRAERNSRLHTDYPGSGRPPDFQGLEGTWYNSFWQLITQDCRIQTLPARLASIALVVFNYDRCVEHYLCHAIQTYYSIPEAQAAEMMQHLRIYHPYGTVGTLPWQRPGRTISFGGEPHQTQLLQLANGIRTFTEGTDEKSSEISLIRAMVNDAPVIVFLGFAYHRMNLEVLFPDSDKKEWRPRQAYGTAKGISSSDIAAITGDVAFRMRTHIQEIRIQPDLSCQALFQEFWRTLSPT